MTAKQFFKSTSFKCIITLLCVLLVSGIFLTIMNSLLKVTDEEKFERAINKIYGKSVKTETITITEQLDEKSYHIDNAYLVKDDGNYLIKATGKGGFDNGTVTCWVVVAVKSGSISGIDKVIIDSNVGQSYIDRVGEKALNQFSELYEDGIKYNPEIITGATVTRTKNAICNAVNGAIAFVNAKFGIVKEDIFKDKEYTDYINTGSTSANYDAETGLVTFEVATSGASYPNSSNNMAGGFTIGISVDVNGVIKSFNILINGSTGDTYINQMLPAILDGSIFVNKNLAGVLEILGGGIDYPGDNAGTVISTGASQSNHQCIYAAAFATKNYTLLLPTEGEEESEGGQENE